MPADIVQFIVSLVPAAILVGIAAIMVVLAGAISTAEPGGLVQRTMDPAASWR